MYVEYPGIMILPSVLIRAHLTLQNEGAENGFVFRTLPKLPAGNSSTIQVILYH